MIGAHHVNSIYYVRYSLTCGDNLFKAINTVINSLILGL